MLCSLSNHLSKKTVWSIVNLKPLKIKCKTECDFIFHNFFKVFKKELHQGIVIIKIVALLILVSFSCSYVLINTNILLILSLFFSSLPRHIFSSIGR